MAKKKGNPVNWFEIPVVNLKRAVRFYSRVFGLRLEMARMEGMTLAFFPMADRTYGAAGALVKAKGYKPSSAGIVLYFSVANIPATLKKVKARGGKVLQRRTSIGQYGFMGRFRDTEGNRVALHSMK